MRKLITLLLMLSGVLAYGQSLTFKTYKNGQVIGSKTIKYPTKVITKVVFKYIPVTKIKKVQVPVDKIQYKIVEVAGKPTALDTVAILQAYYPKNEFKDVLVLPDGQGRISITDSISHNRLASRKWLADINPKVVRETVEVPAPPIREYYIGPEASTNFRSINNWYSLSLLIKNKSNHIVRFSGGINMRDGINGAQPYFATGFYFKIK
jgi:hypothetical protein